MRILVGIGLLFLCSGTFAQNVEFVLTKVKEKYASYKTIEYSAKYMLYKGHQSDVLENEYEGYFYKDSLGAYQKIKETEFVYGSDFFLRIDHEHETVEIDMPKIHVTGEVDLNTALKECYKNTIEEKDDYYKITLFLKSTSTVPLSVMNLRINKKDYTIQQLDLFYSDNIDFSQERSKIDLHQPHMLIRFYDYNLSPEKKTELVRIEEYIDTQGINIKPSKKIGAYRFVDNRI